MQQVSSIYLIPGTNEVLSALDLRRFINLATDRKATLYWIGISTADPSTANTMPHSIKLVYLLFSDLINLIIPTFDSYQRELFCQVQILLWSGEACTNYNDGN